MQEEDLKKRVLMIIGLSLLIGSLASAGSVSLRVAPIIAPKLISCGGNGC